MGLREQQNYRGNGHQITYDAALIHLARRCDFDATFSKRSLPPVLLFISNDLAVLCEKALTSRTRVEQDGHHTQACRVLVHTSPSARCPFNSGVPGDYKLTLLDYIEPAGLPWVGNCNELNAGYVLTAMRASRHRSARDGVTFGVGQECTCAWHLGKHT